MRVPGIVVFILAWSTLSVLMIIVGETFENIDRSILGWLWSFFSIVLVVIYYYVTVTRKPVLYARGKVTAKKNYRGFYSIDVLNINKITMVFLLSREQYNTVKKDEFVDIVYQGWIARSIKKHPNGVVIFHDKASKKILEEKANQITPYKQTTKRK